MRVRDAWSRFHEERRGEVKATTLRDLEFLYETDIAPTLADELLVDLTPERLEAFEMELRERNRSAHRRSGVLRLLTRLKRS